MDRPNPADQFSNGDQFFPADQGMPDQSNPAQSASPFDLPRPMAESDPAADGSAGSVAALSRREAELPTSELRSRRQSESVAASKVSSRLVWLFALLALFVLVRFNLIGIVEEVRYALARGEQRAEVEYAREQLLTNLADTSDAIKLSNKAVSASVVGIEVRTWKSRGRSRFQGDEVTAGQGTGVILDAEGYILTNHHVVEGASSFAVKLKDGRTISDVTLVGHDVETDLAVLKLEADGLIPAEWGDSSRLEIGDWVMAVGNPYGLDRSVTVGIISALRRRGVVSGMNYQSFLQTDAAVNPGNSGGPLISVMDGKIVGITTAIVGKSYRGISLAIPQEIAQRVYDEIRNKGHMTWGWLGVQMQTITPQLASQLNIPERGVRVEQVVGNPAYDAGLRRGDIITAWDDFIIEDQNDLKLRVGLTKASTTARVTVLRGDKEETVDVTVGERIDTY